MINHATPASAKKKVTLLVQNDKPKCSDLQDLMLDAADNDRLRGAQLASAVRLYTQPRHDALPRRIFFPTEIDAERALVKRVLLDATNNVTPERLSRIGSPGRLAILALQRRAARHGRHDIKASHVLSPIALLASGGKKRSFLKSPSKPVKSSKVLQTGAAALAASHDDRRIKLRHFCAGVGVTDSLPRLLRLSEEDNLETLLCGIALFRTVALDCLIKEGEAEYADKDKLFAHLRSLTKDDLQKLFMDRWQICRKSGAIDERSFEWVTAVDWLVNGLQPEGPPNAQGALQPGKTASPVRASMLSSSSSLLGSYEQSPPQFHFSPSIIYQTNRYALLQPGRQAMTIPMAALNASPSRLVPKPRGDRDERPVRPRRKKTGARRKDRTSQPARDDAVSPVARKRRKPAKVSQPVRPVAVQLQPTLQDMLYLVSVGKSLSQAFIAVDVEPLAVPENGDTAS